MTIIPISNIKRSMPDIVVWPKNTPGFALWVTSKMAATLPESNNQSVPFFDIFEADLLVSTIMFPGMPYIVVW